MGSNSSTHYTSVIIYMQFIDFYGTCKQYVLQLLDPAALYITELLTYVQDPVEQILLNTFCFGQLSCSCFLQEISVWVMFLEACFEAPMQSRRARYIVFPTY